MPEVENALPSGYSINEYRIDFLLGAGGFGLTYLATDANLNLKVALKEFLPADLAVRGADSTVQPKSSSAADSLKWGLQRFMEEARTLASFRHPNIVRVMRFFEANHTGYMVMEFVDGTALPDWIQPRRPLPQAAVLGLLGPLLDGLEVIHKAGYLHRDIKPANVFIRSDGSPVLLDFGSARQLIGGNKELTAIVSPGYAPFEQYHTHGKQGPWTDLYALGGVLYWIVSGQKPVDAAARVRTDIMAPAAQVALTTYSNQLLAAIDWALKPNEDERPQSVAELRRALAAATTRFSGSSDRTMPVGAQDVTAARPPAPTATTDASGVSGLTGLALDRGELKRVETELAHRIGPIATMVVRNAARKAQSIAALAEAVAGEIADQKDRAAFLKKFSPVETASGPPREQSRLLASEASISQKFSAAVLKQAETALAQHIGAIARVVVNRAAARARDETELYLLISDEIRDPAERKNFIRKAVSASSRR
jgi:serine/threonine protein kinase